MPRNIFKKCKQNNIIIIEYWLLLSASRFKKNKIKLLNNWIFVFILFVKYFIEKIVIVLFNFSN